MTHMTDAPILDVSCARAYGEYQTKRHKRHTNLYVPNRNKRHNRHYQRKETHVHH